VQLYGERVAQIETVMSQSASQDNADESAAGATGATGANGTAPPASLLRKSCTSNLWNEAEYRQFLSTLTEERNVQDVMDYLHLIQEGNDAIRSKSKLLSAQDDEGGLKRRTRRFDRDYYRTCFGRSRTNSSLVRSAWASNWKIT